MVLPLRVFWENIFCLCDSNSLQPVMCAQKKGQEKIQLQLIITPELLDNNTKTLLSVKCTFCHASEVTGVSSSNLCRKRTKATAFVHFFSVQNYQKPKQCSRGKRHGIASP